MLIRKCFYLLVVFFFISCQNVTYVKVNSVEVPEILIKSKKNYKDLVIESLKGNAVSINEVLNLDLNSDMEFYNGVVIIQIIDNLGEDIFINKIRNYDEYEKLRLQTIINAGFFEIDLKEYKGKKLKNYYPKVYDFLKKQI